MKMISLKNLIPIIQILISSFLYLEISFDNQITSLICFKNRMLVYPQKRISHADANLHTAKANYDNHFSCACILNIFVR